MLAQAWPPGQEVLGSSSAPGDAVNTQKSLLQVLLLSSPQPSWPAGGGTRRVGNKRILFLTVQGRARRAAREGVGREERGKRGQLK